jgi:hypothetical protein
MTPRNRNVPPPVGLGCLFEVLTIYTRLVFGATLVLASLCVLLEQIGAAL